jgi:transcriptional regulator with XRE-family HTH domain
METNFGAWLKEQIDNKNISQKELADMSGVTPAQISRVISGSRGIGSDALSKIAIALNLSPDFVFEKAGLLPPKSDISSTKRAAIHAIEDADEDDADFIYKWLTERKQHKKLSLQTRPQK